MNPVEQRVEQQRGADPRTLRRGSIGVFGVVTMVVAATAPLTALASNFSLSFAFGNGAGTVGMVVLAAAIFFVFSAGYVRISRAVTNAAAYYAYVAYGLGREAGAAAAMVATVAYNFAAAAMVAAAGYFTSLAMSLYAGIDLAWWFWAGLAWMINILLGHFGVGVAARVTATLCAAQFVVLLALSVAVLIRSPGGFEVASTFSPAAVLSGNVGLALLFALLSFSGYEASAAYCEEAREGRRVVGWATYISLAFLTGSFVFSTWAMTAAVDDIAVTAQADPGGLLFVIAESYLGAWIGPVIGFLIAASFLGAMVAFSNLGTRYLFSLGRAGILPSRLSTVHRRRGTTTVAVVAQATITAVVLVPFALGGADPLVRLFPAVSGITSLSVVVLTVGVCLSVLVAHRRGKLNGSWWQTTAAPVISGLALLASGWLIVSNYALITGSTAWYVNAAPGILVLAMAFGAWRQRVRGSTLLDVDIEADPPDLLTVDAPLGASTGGRSPAAKS